MSKKIVVVDLDWTLLNTNTFHKWILFILKKSLFINPLDTLKIFFYSMKRAFKIGTHKELKYAILTISEKEAYLNLVGDFVHELDGYLNRKILEFTTTKDDITILATGAPLLYANTIGKKYNFDYVIATPNITIQPWYETMKEKKKEILLKHLDTLHVDEVDIVLSDHYDDVAIMKLAKEVYLVNPSEKTQKIVTQSSIAYTIL